MAEIAEIFETVSRYYWNAIGHYLDMPMEIRVMDTISGTKSFQDFKRATEAVADLLDVDLGISKTTEDPQILGHVLFSITECLAEDLKKYFSSRAPSGEALTKELLRAAGVVWKTFSFFLFMDSIGVTRRVLVYRSLRYITEVLELKEKLQIIAQARKN